MIFQIDPRHGFILCKKDQEGDLSPKCRSKKDFDKKVNRIFNVNKLLLLGVKLLHGFILAPSQKIRIFFWTESFNRLLPLT